LHLLGAMYKMSFTYILCTCKYLFNNKGLLHNGLGPLSEELLLCYAKVFNKNLKNIKGFCMSELSIASR